MRFPIWYIVAHWALNVILAFFNPTVCLKSEP